MFNLIRLEQELLKAQKQYNDWYMKGYDTPYLTWGEQLDLYKERLDNLKLQARKVTK